MKRTFLLLAVLVFLIAPGTNAKDLQALFYHSSFLHPSEGPFVETYLKVFGPSATYVKTENGKFQASLEVTLLFKQDEEIKTWRKYNLLSGELSDTTGIIPHLIDQQRIPMPNGVYQLELFLKDNNDSSDPLEHAEMLGLEFDTDDLIYSGFQFIESYSVTENENILTKNGYDLIPYVGDFFDADAEQLTFYTELYNLDKKIGNQEDFLFRYYIESFETNFSLGEYSKYQRGKAASVNPLMAAISIRNLATGNYNLVVEAIDRNNQPLLLNKIFFRRNNPGMQLNLNDISSVDVTATFAERITDLDSLRFCVACLRPIGSMLENQFAKNVMDSEDLVKMQQFLFNFWKNRNDIDPEAEWNAYLEQVMQIEETYKTRIKHGFETDMGRVYLKYGTPNQAEESKHEPNSYPYVIWHYYHLGNQTNKRFVFYNPHLAGTEYFLLHSDAKGEIYDPYWQYALKGRNTNVERYEDTELQGGWGSRANELIRR